jgi:hypothetical protein
MVYTSLTDSRLEEVVLVIYAMKLVAENEWRGCLF